VQAHWFRQVARKDRPSGRAPLPSPYSNNISIILLSTTLTKYSVIAHAKTAFELSLRVTLLLVILASNRCVAAVPLRLDKALVAACLHLNMQSTELSD
jgi:hypothetical protein